MSVRKNLGVMGVANFVSFVLNFASVIIISRLLAPTEIGIYSVSVAVLGFAHIFREFGVGEYLVQVRNLGARQLQTAFSVTLYLSWLIALGLFLLRLPLADFYQHPGVSEILALLSINFIIIPFGAPLLSLLRRELEFNKLALNLILRAVVQTSVTVGCALAGESYLSMAWGAIASQVVSVMLLNFLSPGKIFIWPTFRGLGEVINFGSITTMRSIVGVVGGSAPDLIFGRSLGFVDVAYFSRAVGLKKMLIERLNNFVRSVYFPTFASNLRKGEDAAKLYCISTNYLVSITAPVLVVLAIVSEPLIMFLFGDQWSRSAPIASLICIYSLLTAPYSLYGFSLIAAGKIKLSLWVEIAAQSVKVMILLTSFWLDLEQVVMLLLVGFLVEAILSQYALKISFGLKFTTFIGEIRKSLLLIPFSSVGPLVVVWLSYLFEFNEYRLLIILISGLLAAIGWISGVFATQHVMKDEVIYAIGNLRRVIN